MDWVQQRREAWEIRGFQPSRRGNNQRENNRDRKRDRKHDRRRDRQ